MVVKCKRSKKMKVVVVELHIVVFVCFFLSLSLFSFFGSESVNVVCEREGKSDGVFGV